MSYYSVIQPEQQQQMLQPVYMDVSPVSTPPQPSPPSQNSVCSPSQQEDLSPSFTPRTPVLTPSQPGSWSPPSTVGTPVLNPSQQGSLSPSSKPGTLEFSPSQPGSLSPSSKPGTPDFCPSQSGSLSPSSKPGTPDFRPSQPGSLSPSSKPGTPEFCPNHPGRWIPPSTPRASVLSPGHPGCWNPSSITLRSVLYPSVPFYYPITGGIKCGMTISILGKPLEKFQRFTVDLQCGSTLIPPPDIGFRFEACAFSSTVVRNTRFYEVWQDEETAAPYFPFTPNVLFNLTIHIQNDKYAVRVNGRDFINYYHRMSRFALINTLKIDHDVSLVSIEFSEAPKWTTAINLA